MLILVYGGSGSGKSEFAEQLSVRLSKECSGALYYIATMKPWDQECLERIEKHREMRAEKHFHTIECYERPGRIAFPEPEKKVALLECLSNLTANEMFTEPRPELPALEDRLFSDLMALYQKTEHLVIVSNNIFEDGIEYDQETAAYQKLLGRLNQKIANEAEQVYEVTAGIGVGLKP